MKQVQNSPETTAGKGVGGGGGVVRGSQELKSKFNSSREKKKTF